MNSKVRIHTRYDIKRSWVKRHATPEPQSDRRQIQLQVYHSKAGCLKVRVQYQSIRASEHQSTI